MSACVNQNLGGENGSFSSHNLKMCGGFLLVKPSGEEKIVTH